MVGATTSRCGCDDGAELATGRKVGRAGPGGDSSMEGAEAGTLEGAALSRDLQTLG